MLLTADARAKLRDRTRAGLVRARLLGRRLGRPPAIPDLVRARALELRGARPEMSAGAIKRALVAEGLGVYHIETVRSLLKRGRC
jgi:DNA invertase Pin-like site-specific DNA recombinase